jgi:fucose permease
MSYALVHSRWQSGYRIIGTVQFCIAAVILLTLSLWKVHAKEEEEVAESKPIGVIGALRIRGVLPLLLGFMCYCAAETTCMLWTATFLIGTRGVSKEQAAAYAALFFIGITVGRFLSGLISNHFGDRKMIRIGTGIVAVGVLMIAVPAFPTAVALVGCVVIGFGCAPVYPSVIHSTPDNFGKENSQAIIGVQMASAYVGSTFMPPLFGVLASVTGMWLMPYYVGAFFVAMILLMERTFRLKA